MCNFLYRTKRGLIGVWTGSHVYYMYTACLFILVLVKPELARSSPQAKALRMSMLVIYQVVQDTCRDVNNKSLLDHGV